ncbi:MAG: hypothetical protein WCD51_06320, partial [Anaerolineae bacterium]
STVGSAVSVGSAPAVGANVGPGKGATVGLGGVSVASGAGLAQPLSRRLKIMAQAMKADTRRGQR